MIDELAGENLGAVKIGKVNIDDNQQAAFDYGIEAIGKDNSGNWFSMSQPAK